MRHETINLTPEWAAEHLALPVPEEYTPGPYSQVQGAQLAAQLRRRQPPVDNVGELSAALATAGIVLARNGAVLIGVHRLAAAAAAGLTGPLAVTWLEPQEVVEYVLALDRSAPRQDR